MNDGVVQGLTGWVDLKPFKMWCCKVLPAVFDDSMSYYEVLCRVKEVLNGVITDVQLTQQELESFQNSVTAQFEELKSGTWIDGTIPYLSMLLEKYIPVGIMFGLTDTGYFTAYIPDGWDEITFNTTGFDISLQMQPEYGHLVLSY